MTTPIFFPDAWEPPLANHLLLSHPQVWEHPFLLFDEGIDTGTFTIQSGGLDLNLIRPQLAQSHLHTPQIDWGSSQEPPVPYDTQATIPVSITVYQKLD